MTNAIEPSSLPAARGAVVVLIVDLFFSVTIRATLLRLGFDAVLVCRVEQAADRVADDDVRLVVVDGTAVRAAEDWQQLGHIDDDGVPVLVFGPHKDVETLRAAKDAGVTRVVANSQFHREMAALVERYALATATHRREAGTSDPAD